MAPLISPEEVVSDSTLTAISVFQNAASRCLIEGKERPWATYYSSLVREALAEASRERCDDL